MSPTGERHNMRTYGPNWRPILFVKEEQVPHLTSVRARTIVAVGSLASNLNTSQSRAFDAARTQDGREQQMVRASEDLRRAVWDVIWDSSWAEAWKLSWVISRAGLGLATYDLVGTGNYTVEDYIDLVGPWTAGFKDMPIPHMERAA